MKVSKQQIDTLMEWFSPRLGELVAHGEKVRQILDAAKSPDQILESALKFVQQKEDSASHAPLSPSQIAVYEALLPMLTEHAIAVVKGNDEPLESDTPLTKEEAAKYLGIKTRKLEACMKKRQIAYQKLGAGKNAAVRFCRADLDKYRESRTVGARTNKS